MGGLEEMNYLSYNFIIFIFSSSIILLIIGYFWFYRACKIIENYLDNLSGVLSCQRERKRKFSLFYSRYELSGTYKGRPVIAGIQYVGLGFEWMPLPYIKIKLKDVIRYNYNRLPDFAYIKMGWLVFKIKERLTWGVFDKNYNRFFTKDFVLIALTRLLAVAEDVERGKTLEEIFK